MWDPFISFIWVTWIWML